MNAKPPKRFGGPLPTPALPITVRTKLSINKSLESISCSATSVLTSAPQIAVPPRTSAGAGDRAIDSSGLPR
jgi:hypothetical protein